MRPDEIISFFVSVGNAVVKTASCAWYNDPHQNQMYQAFPMHRMITPTRDELREVFAKTPRAWAVRFISPPGTKGEESFIWVRRAPYDIGELSPNTRSRVRRGLKRCQIRSMRFEELARLGWECHLDTAKRHGERTPTSLGLPSTLDNCAAYEAHGAFVGESLAAYVVTLRVEDWAYILVNRSATAHLGSYANNALVFSVAREMLARPDVTVVSYGIEGLVTVESLERFKTSMGFVKDPVRQRIVLAPLLKPLINPFTAAPINAVATLMRKNLSFQKLAGFCRVASHS